MNTKATPSYILEATASRLGIKKILLVALLMSFTTNVILSLTLAYKETPTQTILIPEIAGPVSRSPWIVGTKGVSDTYLEEFALWLLPNYTNFTPENIDASIKKLLTFVHPRVYSELETRLMLEAKSLKEDHATSMFFPQSVKVDTTNLKVAISGEKTSMIGSKVTETKLTTLTLNFSLVAGRLYLESISQN